MRPIRKAEHIVYKGPGVKAFKFGNQTIILKAVPPSKVRRFVPKKFITADMWKDMLKKIPPKPKMKAKAKEKRPDMKEVILRAEKTIRIATRDTLEEYCREYCKEGLPGKKHKPRKLKPKDHSSALHMARKRDANEIAKTGMKKANYYVSTNRFEVWNTKYTVGDPKSMFAQFASYTIRIGDDGMDTLPEPTFEEIEVASTINVPTEDEDDDDDDY